MFQAPYKDYTTEFSLLHAVLWEYIEELFSIPDPEHRTNDAKWFYSLAPAAELLSMIAKGTARLRVTGVAVNLASMRPEILTLLEIFDEAWFRRHQEGTADATLFKFSTELASAGDVPLASVPMRCQPIRNTPQEVFQDAELSPGTVVPVAAAAIYQGLRALGRS